MNRSTREAARTLLAQAIEQGGHFTAKQARIAGYDYPHLEYHVSTGSFERVNHGLYRITSLPSAEHDDLIRLALWSRNRQDEPQAVASHESALVLHNLADLLPDMIHLTVPPTFRKKPPTGCLLHKAILTASDVEERTGFRVTTPLRTLLDVAASNLSQEQFDKAVSEALRRGLVRRAQLVTAARGQRRLDRLRNSLKDEPSSAP
jgi:predicted transcriptional regulator of viral defense system